MNLTDLAVVLLMGALGDKTPATPDNLLVARSIAEAVELDTEEPIMGSKEGDVALGMAFARHESDFRSLKDGRCITGDGGLALGPWQLQHVLAAIACVPRLAAKRWLQMAHDSVKRCMALLPDERLAALASGNCEHGRSVSIRRVEQARRDLERVQER